MHRSENRRVVNHNHSDRVITKQEFAEDCNVNTIIKKMTNGGMLGHINPAEPKYVDTTVVGDLQAAYLLIEETEEQFMELPADIRAAADNDPIKLAEMAGTVEGREKLKNAGMEPGLAYVKTPEPVTPEPNKAPDTPGPDPT